MIFTVFLYIILIVNWLHFDSFFNLYILIYLHTLSIYIAVCICRNIIFIEPIDFMIFIILFTEYKIAV